MSEAATHINCNEGPTVRTTFPMQLRYPTLVTTLVAGSFFMENLDGTIIATALPQMARNFHTSAVSLNIGITAYLITLAVFIPISGWIADRFGGRTVFTFAIGIFTLASVLCGLSHSLTQFTLLRVLQGVGGAMMVPVGRLIVLRSTPKTQLTQAIAYITWPALTGLVIGPPIGGYITTYYGWHWIFFLNLPLGLVALILSLCWIDNARSDFATPEPFDWLTFLLAGFASAGVVYALEQLGRFGVNWRQPATMLAVSVASGALAMFAARRSPDSPVDLEALKIKSYRLSIFGASGFRIAVSVLPFLLPLMLQVSCHLDAFTSGMYLLALFAGDLGMKAFIIPALRCFGFRRILIVNGLAAAGSIALCATIGPSTTPALIIAILVFHGACRSLEFTCMTTLAYAEIAPERMSRANGFLSAVTQLSLGIGVALGAVSLRLTARYHGHSSAFPGIRDFHVAILCAALLSLAPVIEALSLGPNAGSETSGHVAPIRATRRKTALPSILQRRPDEQV
jgi:EmrB/QacA subfamily drug resistance transporter